MKRWITGGIYAGVLVAASGSTPAAITLVQTSIPLTNSTLKAHWFALQLTLIADPGSVIAGFDFRNSGAGITGLFHQRWTIGPVGEDPDTGDTIFGTISTPSGSFPSETATSTALTDSFFGFPGSLVFAEPTPLTENNNLSNGPNIFTDSPLTDTSTTDFGVGTLMTAKGLILPENRPSTLNLAFLIVPKNFYGHIQGYVFDTTTTYVIDSLIPPCLIFEGCPEPANLVCLGLSMLFFREKRRRRTY